MAEDIRAEHADDCLIHGYIGGGDEGCTCGAEPSAESELVQLRASLAQVTQDAQLVADVLAEYADELDKAACDRCEQCGPGVMCSFHSVLSALQRHTWTNGAIERDRLKRELSTLSASLAAAQAEITQLQEAKRKHKKNANEVIEQLEAEITRLQGYVQHKDECALRHLRAVGGNHRHWCAAHSTRNVSDCDCQLTPETCTCGLDPAPLPKEPTTP